MPRKKKVEVEPIVEPIIKPIPEPIPETLRPIKREVINDKTPIVFTTWSDGSVTKEVR